MDKILLNVVLSAAGISAVLFFARTNTVLAGFLGSLPLATIITFLLLHRDGGSMEDVSNLGKSILAGISTSLVFFIPFILPERMRFSFWVSFSMGLGFLALSYFAHRFIVSSWLR